MVADIKRTLIADIVEGAMQSVSKLVPEEAKRNNAKALLEANLQALDLDNLNVQVTKMKEIAIKGAGQSIVKAMNKGAAITETELGNALTEGVAGAFLGKSGLEESVVKSKLNTLGALIGKSGDEALNKVLDAGKSAKAHEKNGFVRFGLGIGLGALGINRVIAAFKPKTVINENGEQEKVSKPWYNRMLNFVVGAGLTVLSVQMVAQGKTFRQSAVDMTSPIKPLSSWVEKVMSPQNATSAFIAPSR